MSTVDQKVCTGSPLLGLTVDVIRPMKPDRWQLCRETDHESQLGQQNRADSALFAGRTEFTTRANHEDTELRNLHSVLQYRRQHTPQGRILF